MYNNVTRGLVTALGGIVLNMIIIPQHIGFLMNMQFSEFDAWISILRIDFATTTGTMPMNISDKGQVQGARPPPFFLLFPFFSSFSHYILFFPFFSSNLLLTPLFWGMQKKKEKVYF